MNMKIDCSIGSGTLTTNAIEFFFCIYIFFEMYVEILTAITL